MGRDALSDEEVKGAVALDVLLLVVVFVVGGAKNAPPNPSFPATAATSPCSLPAAPLALSTSSRK